MPIRSTDQILHKAAWLYYTHGLRQDEVAQRLNISRASVATYLRRARETGIVNISTSTQLFADDILARQLEDALGLTSVWIVPEDRQAMDPTAEMPVVAAAVFLELINKGDRVGSPGAARSIIWPMSCPMPTCRVSPLSSCAEILERLTPIGPTSAPRK